MDKTLENLLEKTTKALKERGLTQAEVKPKQVECEYCNDLGFYRVDVPYGHPQFGKMQRCSCKILNDVYKLQKISGMTNLEASFRLDNIINRGEGSKKLIEAGRRFIEDPNEIITVYGGSGNAKSLFLAAVVNELLERGVEALYITSFDLLDYIRDSFNNDDVSTREVMEKFMTIDVLAIDEFDKVNTTDWVTEQITSLLDRRHRLSMSNEAGTLIATNTPVKEFLSWMASRLRSKHNTLIKNTDNDFRIE